MEEETIESLSKKAYKLGRKLYELQVAKELTRDPEKLKQYKKHIEDTTNELKSTFYKKAQLKYNLKEGKKK